MLSELGLKGGGAIGQVDGLNLQIFEAGGSGGKGGPGVGQIGVGLALGVGEAAHESRIASGLQGEIAPERGNIVGIGIDRMVQLLRQVGVLLMLHPQNDAEAQASQDQESGGQV